MEDRKMKTHAKHSDSKLGYILFGLVITAFTVLITLNFLEQKRSTFNRSGFATLISKNLSTPVSNPVTIAEPFELTELLVSAEEPVLVVDQWMTDLSTWNTSATANAFSASAFTSEEIAIENWMLSTSSWTSGYEDGLKMAATEVVEPAIEVENWMLNTTSWLEAGPWMTTASETETTVEDWMLDSSSFVTAAELAAMDMVFEESEITIENWMLNVNGWNEYDSYSFSAELTPTNIQ
jgi:hypothetical protein